MGTGSGPEADLRPRSPASVMPRRLESWGLCLPPCRPVRRDRQGLALQPVRNELIRRGTQEIAEQHRQEDRQEQHENDLGQE